MPTLHRSGLERDVVARVPKALLVGGQWQPAGSGRTMLVYDPATGQPVAEVADGDARDAEAALSAAYDVQGPWAATPPRRRADILRDAYAGMVENAEELALLMTVEMGKPLAESHAEVIYAAEFLRWFSEEAVRIDGGYRVAGTGLSRVLVSRHAVGPCLAITPCNFPAAMVARKVGPALAAGCTVVLKPAEQTPLSALAMAETLRRCGLPAGVLNVVTTSEASPTTGPLFSDSRLRKVSFTGSTAVGKRLMASAAEQVLRISLELGGNAPFIVFGDADLDAAVAGALVAKMRNGGEACTAANRIYAHASIADEFTDRLVSALSTVNMGRGTEPGVTLGPMIDGRQRTKVALLVEDGLTRGALRRCGGYVPPGPGYFYPPTVLTGVPADAGLATTEIFGPVAPVMTFETDEEVILAANRVDTGLAAYVYTRDLSRAFLLAETLEVGMIGLNRGTVSDPSAPFGGVKQSGTGREGGDVGIGEYLETRYVSIDKTW